LVPWFNLVLFASMGVCCARRPATRYRAARERHLSRARNACAGSSSEESTKLKHGTKLGRTLCYVDQELDGFNRHVVGPALFRFSASMAGGRGPPGLAYTRHCLVFGLLCTMTMDQYSSLRTHPLCRHPTHPNIAHTIAQYTASHRSSLQYVPHNIGSGNIV